MPKKRNIENIVKQTAIIKPLLELANINEKRKNKKVKRFIKNITKKMDELGSVK